MLIKVTEERDIESIEDLRFKKQLLIKKADKRAKKISKKVKKLSLDTKAPDIYDEILSQFDLQHSLMNMLPLILKYREQIGNIKFVKDIKNSPRKRFAVITLGAVAASLLTYFHLSKKSESKQKPKKEEQKPKKEKQGSPNHNGLFV